MNASKQFKAPSPWLFAWLTFSNLACVTGYVTTRLADSSNTSGDFEGIAQTSIVVLIVLPILLVVSSAVFAASPFGRRLPWEKPAWNKSPFRRGPHQLMHAIATASLAGGFGASAAFLVGRTTDIKTSILPIVVGSAILLGINMTQEIFARRYKPLPDDANAAPPSLRHELLTAFLWVSVLLLAAGFIGAMAYLSQRIIAMSG